MRILATFVALALTGAPLVAREPTQEDYDVWATVIPSDYPGTDPVYVWHLADSPSVFARGRDAMVLQKHSEFLPAASSWRDAPAEIDIDKLNAAIRANNGLRFMHPIKLLDQQMLEHIVGRPPKTSWIASPSLTSGVEAIYRLSWPAYREDGRSALVMTGAFSMWKADIWEFVVGKNEKGRWWPTSNSYWTLLCWGSTPPPPGCDSRLFIE